ncbi:IS110 family transposase [Mariniphaga sediminis]|uniref:IS110 family transposase n=1 Tax=Mariniphaga sediminis TaxID=1628158 RepID=A0A399CXC3_9BACT|nr:IS110 family transposase [Mariniphaga sediminis]RIH62700.1 IS110 family transposase [Mariniphaga sediminis]
MKNNDERLLKKKRYSQGLPVLNIHAAGIDIGGSKHDVAISDGFEGHIVCEFGTYTQDLKGIVTWLLSHDITTAAIESTGVYWLNLYIMLEEAGIEPYLVNAKHVKNVTGRKKDDTDAIWLQKLHCCGLLQKSFQPNSYYRKLRTYVRQRKKLIRLSSDCVRRMQKAFELMNIKLHNVISDIIGKTGILIIEAIINGERNPEELLKFKDGRIKASDTDIKLSLEGIWKEEYLFMLGQAYEGYLFYQNQIKSCDCKIEGLLLSQAATILDGDISGLGGKKKKVYGSNQYYFDVQGLLKVIVGVNLCRVDSISEISALEFISETGIDMSKWKSHKQFAAWLNLAPNTKITGGKVVSSRMQKKKNHAGLALRMAASNLSKCKSPLGDYARKMKSRVGKKGAVIASAHKLSKIVYTMIRDQKEYDRATTLSDQVKWREKRIKNLEKQLEKLKKVA